MSEKPAGEIELARGEELGGYRIRSRVGGGSRGSLWSAVDPLTGAKAAIKIVTIRGLEPEAIEARLEAHRQRLAAKSCEGVTVPLASGHLSGPHAFLVRSFAVGRSLRELAAAGLCADDARDLVVAVARRVAVMHRAGLSHGHLSPENIFITPAVGGEDSPRVVLTDLGVEELAPAAQPSPYSAAPGGVQQDAASSQAGDLRALAVLGYELFHGRVPAQQAGVAFRGEIGEVTARVLAEDHPAPLEDADALAEALEGLRLRATQTEIRRQPPAPAEPKAAAGSRDVDLIESDDEAAATPSAMGRGQRRSWHVIGALRVACWIALCVFGVTGTYRLLLGHWPWADSRHAPGEARLEVVSTPAGATVFLDDEPQAGRTPVTLSVRRGRPYHLVVQHPKHRVWTQTVALGLSEDTRRLDVRLAARQILWGTLELSANVQADFFLDDRCVGTQTARVTLAEVRAGVEHRLRVRAPGRQVVLRRIRVQAGKVRVLAFRLAPELAIAPHAPRRSR